MLEYNFTQKENTSTYVTLALDENAVDLDARFYNVNVQLAAAETIVDFGRWIRFVSPANVAVLSYNPNLNYKIFKGAVEIASGEITVVPSSVVPPGGGDVAAHDHPEKSASNHTHLSAGVTNFNASTDARINLLKGTVNGLAGLDAGGKVPASQLPAYVDDVLEYNNLAALPATGSAGLIYITKDTNKVYRWSGSAYIEIFAASGEVTLAGVQTLTNKTLTSPVINSPTGLVKANVGLGNVDNTSDANKQVSTAQQIALNLKANNASPIFTGLLTTPTIKITGGTPGAGKVLTSDADGDALWTALASSPDTGVYNFVDRYGADKTGVADCTAAYNAARTEILAAGGGTLFVPAGTYKFSGATRLAPVDQKFSIWGAGSNVSNFLFTHLNGGLDLGKYASSDLYGGLARITISGNGVAYQPLYVGWIIGWVIEDVQVTAAAYNAANPANSAAVIFEQSQNLILINLRVRNNAHHGVIGDNGTSMLRWYGGSISNAGQSGNGGRNLLTRQTGTLDGLGNALVPNQTKWRFYDTYIEFANVGQVYMIELDKATDWIFSSPISGGTNAPNGLTLMRLQAGASRIRIAGASFNGKNVGSPNTTAIIGLSVASGGIGNQVAGLATEFAHLNQCVVLDTGATLSVLTDPFAQITTNALYAGDAAGYTISTPGTLQAEIDALEAGGAGSGGVSTFADSTVTALTLSTISADIIRQTNAAAIQTTVPTNTAQPIPIGKSHELMQGGVGQITVVPASGVTIHTLENSYVSSGPGAILSLTKIGTNEWLLTGATQQASRIIPRVFTAVSTGSLVPEISTYGSYFLTGQGVALNIANHITSVPQKFEKIQIRVRDNGVARAITYGTNYVGNAGIPLPTTTKANKRLHMGFEWDDSLAKYVLLALAEET